MVASRTKMLPIVGVGLALALFAAVGLLPAMVDGGYASVLLATGISGAPIRSTGLTRALVVLGMVVGVVTVGALFAVLGAAAGGAVRVLTGAASRSSVARASEAARGSAAAGTRGGGSPRGRA